MNTEQGIELASRLNLGEVTAWRLHLLLCRLSEVHHEMTSSQLRGGYSDLINGPFAALLARVKSIEEDYGQIRRETQFMLGLNSSAEVEPLFDALPKNAEYVTEMQEAKASLQAVVDNNLAVEARFLRGCIQNVYQTLT